MRHEILNSLLSRATTEPLGLVIETNNSKVLNEQYLQSLRTNHPDPEVRKLIIAIPSKPNTIFICQPSIDLEIELEIET